MYHSVYLNQLFVSELLGSAYIAASVFKSAFSNIFKHLCDSVVVDLVLLFAEKMRQEHVRIFGTGGGFARLDCFATRTPKKTCTKFWRCRVFDLQIAVLMLVQRILFNPCRPTDQHWNHCFKTPKKRTVVQNNVLR